MNRRGSALVYVIIVVFSITSVVLISARIASSTESEFNSRYDDARFKAMADGARAEAVADAYKGTLTVGDRTSTVSGVTTNTRVLEKAGMNRAFELTITARINGRDFSAVRVIGRRAKPSPFYYGLWSFGDHEDKGFATTVNGSLYIGGNPIFTGAHTIQEDALVRSTTAITAANVNGHMMTGVRQQLAPTIPTAGYTGIGTVLSSNKLDSIAFDAENVNGYPVWVRTGNLTLNGGTMSGRGTVYVTGNLTVDGTYNYAAADSRAVFIVGGTLRVSAPVSTLVGSFYSVGRAQISPAALTVLRGNIATADRFDRSGSITLTQDTALLEDALEATKLHLPGLWTP